MHGSIAYQLALLIVFLCAVQLRAASTSAPTIDRHGLVSRFNPTRNASNPNTPMQVGNGFFAFGADVTGLQTFFPFAIMSDWGWKNDSLPTGMTPDDILTYRGVVWDGVQYMFDGPEPMQQWLISNPNRVNLGRVGLVFRDPSGKVQNISEADLDDIHQELDLWTGVIMSQFVYQGEQISVKTYSSQNTSAVAVEVDSPLLQKGQLSLFLDFPWNDGSQKFEAPFVGTWNNTDNHTTSLETGNGTPLHAQAQIEHTLVTSKFITSIGATAKFTISRDSPASHRYNVFPDQSTGPLSVVIAFDLEQPASILTFEEIVDDSTKTWEDYWLNSGFVDLLTGSTDSRAEELQRRTILSRYLMRVNEAGHTPPQEVRQNGLVYSFR